MKKFIFLTSIMIVFLIAPMVMADQVQIGYPGSSYGIWQTGQGGEFTLKPIGFDPLSLYDSKAKNVGVSGTFQSFCIEGLETINGYPTTYDSVISDTAMYGGQPTGGDPISKGTAWLYHEFQLGRLSVQTAAGALYAYDYANTTNGRHTDAGLLQNAIWWLEGEKSITYSASNPFMYAVDSMFGVDAKADNGGTYPVAVLNLWDVGYVGVSGHQHQDQLICTPVPEPATMLLLGSGLIGLAGVARRRFRK